jgi:hypothetical protein
MKRGKLQPVCQCLAAAYRSRELFIFECDFQRCAKPRSKLLNVTLPARFLGKITPIAPRVKLRARSQYSAHEPHGCLPLRLRTLSTA